MNDRTKVDEVDVLVAGGGPTGLTLACDLARRGISVRVVEKNRQPFSGSRGKGLSPRTLEVFDDLGVIGAVLAAGSEYPRMRMHFGWVTLPWDMVKRAKPSAEVPYPNIWMHPQNRTEAVLRARLGELGGAVEMGTELVAFEQDAGGVAMTLVRDGGEERLRARYLVGADGARGMVRTALGVRFEGERIDGPGAIVGDVRVDDLRPDVWHVWPRARGGPIALCPLPGGRLFQLYLQRSVPAEDEVTEASVRAIVSSAIGKGAPQIREAAWLSVFRPNVRLVERYRVGRVFLAGDAAHVHPPTGGQGLNSGVQDAYNLGWKLAAVLGGAPETLLDTYEEERRPVAASILGLSTKLYRERSLRRGDDTKQLRTHYRGSSLAPEAGERGRVRAGDRAPDAEGGRVGGGSARLFESFRGPHATVLSFGEDVARAIAPMCDARDVAIVLVVRTAASAVSGCSVFVEPGGRLQSAYDADADTLVVVRPDGYVGLVGSWELAAEYLRRILPRRAPGASASRPAQGPATIEVSTH